LKELREVLQKMDCGNCYKPSKASPGLISGPITFFGFLYSYFNKFFIFFYNYSFVPTQNTIPFAHTDESDQVLESLKKASKDQQSNYIFFLTKIDISNPKTKTTIETLPKPKSSKNVERIKPIAQSNPQSNHPPTPTPQNKKK
jgi:hypothetical protein